MPRVCVMRNILIIILLLVVWTSFGQGQVKVDFRVNMGAAVYNKSWDPAKDSVMVRGNFQTDAGDPGYNWSGYYFKMSLIKDTIYGVSATFPNSCIGKSYQYKYVIGPDSWETTSNRYFNCPTKDSALTTNWYNNDNVHIPHAIATNTINFCVNVKSIMGTGDGWFEPATDSIFLIGINENTNVNILYGDGKMIQDTNTPGLFSTKLILQGRVGTSCSFKYKINPPDKFYNAGIETETRWYVFQTDGSVVNPPVIIPDIRPIKPNLSEPLTTLFECNMNNNPVNRFNNRPIPVDSVSFIGIKGGNSTLGLWGGYWQTSDTEETSNKSMIVLNDKGLFGDRIAGDRIFSRNVIFPKGTASGDIQFKFGAWYPAASTDAGGVEPLNNELPYDKVHIFSLETGSPASVSFYFGGNSFTTSNAETLQKKIGFSLSQNYPNPFNPVTKITYSIPNSGYVTLKVFDILGREAAVLVSGEKLTGVYSADFNAANLPSGIYIYKLSIGDNSITRKMLLLK